jgi:Bacterial regulatory helix-turn-helix protein, lysR family
MSALRKERIVPSMRGGSRFTIAMSQFGTVVRHRVSCPVERSVSATCPADVTFESSKALKLDPLSLRLFVSVVEDGTIAAAATREHIAAAAVSKLISELEDLLGVQLLVRTNKGGCAHGGRCFIAVQGAQYPERPDQYRVADA